MAYSGRYSIKNASKYKGDANNIIYRSLWEKAVFQWGDKNPKVKQWSSEEIVIPYYYEVDKKYHRYFVDMNIVFEDKTILVEIQPEKEGNKIKQTITDLVKCGKFMPSPSLKKLYSPQSDKLNLIQS